jgi:hypothetical protein
MKSWEDIKWDIRDWFRYTMPRPIREGWWAIRAFFNPRQRWLTKKIPYQWIDKDSLIEICLLESLKHYVEGEDVFNVLSRDNPPYQKKFLDKVEHYYKVVTVQLTELEKQLAVVWNNVPCRDLKDINNQQPGDYERIYGEVDRLEKQIKDLKTEVMVWIVTERESLWT